MKDAPNPTGLVAEVENPEPVLCNADWLHVLASGALSVAIGLPGLSAGVWLMPRAGTDDVSEPGKYTYQ